MKPGLADAARDALKSVNEAPVGHPSIGRGRRTPVASGTTRSAPALEAASRICGNKYANLEQLAWLASQDPGARVEVPAFLGVPHRSVARHLARHAPEFEETWARFVTAERSSGGVLTDELRARLGELRAMVLEAFERHLFAVDGAWLSGRADARLMVRSTGREDSESMENAGGNQSIANVAPSPQEVSRAIGEVVASYFSEQSVAQRLVAKDDLSKPPFMPVLLQEMVGEKAGGAVPVSGVMFGAEVEGQTPNVSVINATFGHNEGVVVGRVPVDTYYLHAADGVHAMIAVKDRRLAPKAEGGLEERPNVEVRPESPAISEGLLARLSQIGDRISAHYGRPMDIEWTYDPDEDVLHLFQARPLVAHAHGVPSHLVPEKLEGCSRRAATVIGAAGGQVRSALEPEALITAKTLPEALAQLLGRPAGSPRPVAALVETWGPPTSHEATNFRAAGIAVLQVAGGLGEVRGWLGGGGAVLVDPQRGEVVDASSRVPEERTPAALEAALRSSGALADGWSSHPLPAALSIPDAMSPAAGAELAGFARSLGVFGPLERPDEGEGANRLLRSLSRVKAAPADRAAGAALVRTTVQVAMKAVREGASLADARAVVWQVIADARRLFTGSAERSRIETLYTLNWLEAALLQPRSALVDARSLLGLISETRERQRFQAARPSEAPASAERARALSSAAEYELTLDRLTKTALTPEAADAWRTFIRTLTRELDPEATQLLAGVVREVQRLGLAPTWLNQSFLTAWRAAEHLAQAEGAGPRLLELLSKKDVRGRVHPESARAGVCARMLADELRAPGNAAAFEAARARSKVLEAWKARVDQLADPRGFDRLFAELERDLGATNIGDLDPSSPVFDAAGDLGKNAILACARETIELFDGAIKSLTGSAAYPDPTLKVARFARMLEPYLKMMEAWAGIAPVPGGPTSPAELVDAVRQRLDRIASGSEVLAAEQLRPSGGFDVSGAMLGSGALYERHAAETLEDLFTLIHQSALAALSMIQEGTTIAVDRMPRAVELLSKAIESVSLPRGLASPRLMGVDYRYPELVLDYNAPLRNHSARLRLSTLPEASATRPVDLRLETFALNQGRDSRLERVAFAGYAAAAGSGIGFAPGGEPSVRERTGSFTWRIDPENIGFEPLLAKLPTLIQQCLQITFDEAVPVQMLIRTFAGDDPTLAEPLLETIGASLPALAPEFGRLLAEHMPDDGDVGEYIGENGARFGEPLWVSSFCHALLERGMKLERIPEVHRTAEVLRGVRLEASDWLLVPWTSYDGLLHRRGNHVLAGAAHKAVAEGRYDELGHLIQRQGDDYSWASHLLETHGAAELSTVLRAIDETLARQVARDVLQKIPDADMDLPSNVLAPLLDDETVRYGAIGILLRKSLRTGDLSEVRALVSAGESRITERLVAADPSVLPADLRAVAADQARELENVLAGRPLERVPELHRTLRVTSAALARSLDEGRCLSLSALLDGFRRAGPPFAAALVARHAETSWPACMRTALAIDTPRVEEALIDAMSPELADRLGEIGKSPSDLEIEAVRLVAKHERELEAIPEILRSTGFYLELLTRDSTAAARFPEIVDRLAEDADLPRALKFRWRQPLLDVPRLRLLALEAHVRDLRYDQSLQEIHRALEAYPEETDLALKKQLSGPWDDDKKAGLRSLFSPWAPVDTGPIVQRWIRFDPEALAHVRELVVSQPSWFEHCASVLRSAGLDAEELLGQDPSLPA